MSKYQRRYTYQDLADRTGLSVFTIRYYKNRGMLPPPLPGEYKHGIWGDEHLQVLFKIRDYPDRSYSLDDIRDALYPESKDDDA